MACSSPELHAIYFLWAHVFYVLILLSPLPSIFVRIRIEWPCHFNPLNPLRKEKRTAFLFGAVLRTTEQILRQFSP